MEWPRHSELIIVQIGKEYPRIAQFLTKDLHLDSGTIYLPRVDAVTNHSVTDSFPASLTNNRPG